MSSPTKCTQQTSNNFHVRHQNEDKHDDDAQISHGSSPPQRISAGILPAAVPVVPGRYGQAALRPQRERLIQVERDELVLETGRVFFVESLDARGVVVAGDVRRRGHRVRRQVSRERQLAVELVTYRGRRREVVETGHVLQRVGARVVRVEGARGVRRLLPEVKSPLVGGGGVVGGYVDAVGVDVRLRVPPAGVQRRVVDVDVVDDGGRRAREFAAFCVLDAAPPELVLGFVYEEEDGGNAGQLGSDEAGHVEEKRVAVTVGEGGRLQLGPRSQLAPHLGFEDGDVHYEAQQHYETCEHFQLGSSR